MIGAIGSCPQTQRVAGDDEARGARLGVTSGGPRRSTLTGSPEIGATLDSVPLRPDPAVLGSATLKAGTVHAVSPAPTACSLFAEAEANAILGPAIQASTSDSFSYVTTGSSPQNALTLSLRPASPPPRPSRDRERQRSGGSDCRSSSPASASGAMISAPALSGDEGS